MQNLVLIWCQLHTRRLFNDRHPRPVLFVPVCPVVILVFFESESDSQSPTSTAIPAGVLLNLEPKLQIKSNPKGKGEACIVEDYFAVFFESSHRIRTVDRFTVMTKNTTMPSGWLNCPNAGTVVADKFIAFKTPLSSEFENRMKKDDRWNTESVFNYLKERNIQMGLWIDLTNTDRYFRKAEVEKHQIRYIKLKIGGGGEVPSALAVAEFLSHCRQFFKTNPNSVIGVHCTHGFNRTGYLICTFLTRVAKQNIHEAFTEFCAARPPGIYRQGYVSNLWEMYASPGLPAVPSVVEPGWSQRRERSSDTKNWRAETSSTSGTATKRPMLPPPISQSPLPPKRITLSREMRNPQFFGGVPGIDYVEEPWLRHQVLQDARKMCLGSMKLPFRSSYYSEFPGRRGRELGTEDLEILNSDYSVTWIEEMAKYLLLIKTINQVFFIDSSSHVFRASGMTFPDRKDPRRRHLEDTLVDGEAMLCEHRGERTPRFFTHDIVHFNGSPLTHLSHPERLSLLKKEVLDTRITALNMGIINRRKESTLWLTPQQFWPITSATQLLEPGFLSENPKGLRFMPVNEEYKPQSFGSVLNWTLQRDVNFRIEVNPRSGRADLFTLEEKSPFASAPIHRNLEECDGKIGKFSYDVVAKKWIFVEGVPTHMPGSCADALGLVNGVTSGDPVPVATLLSAIQRNLGASS